VRSTLRSTFPDVVESTTILNSISLLYLLGPTSIDTLQSPMISLGILSTLTLLLAMPGCSTHALACSMLLTMLINDAASNLRWITQQLNSLNREIPKGWEKVVKKNGAVFYRSVISINKKRHVTFCRNKEEAIDCSKP